MFREPPFRNFPPYLKIISLLLVIVITFLFVLALGAGLSIPFFGKGILESISQNSDFSDPRAIMGLKYFQIVNQIGVFVLPAIIFVILTDDSFGGYMKLKGKMHTFSLIFGIVLIFVSLPFNNWLLQINQNISFPSYLVGVENWMRASEDGAEKLTDAFLKTTSFGGLMLNILMISIIAAIGEEFIFRGILVRLFREWTGNIHLGVFIPAFIFSALHLQFFGFIPRLVLGLILGYLFVWSNSLWVPIAAHFINNTMAVLISFLDNKGIISLNFENFGSTNNVWVITGSFIITIFILLSIRFHEQREYRKLFSKDAR